MQSFPHIPITGCTIQRQGTHGTGKTGKMAKSIPCQGKQGIWNFFQNTGNFVKTQAILLAQVNALILKVKDIAILAAKKSFFFFQKLDRSAKLVLCM